MPEHANLQLFEDASPDGKKNMFMSGVFIQGNTRNQNKRVYPVNEIAHAVKSLKERINGGYSILGEADHPDDLNINIDRVSHMIMDMEHARSKRGRKIKAIAYTDGRYLQNATRKRR